MPLAIYAASKVVIVDDATVPTAKKVINFFGDANGSLFPGIGIDGEVSLGAHNGVGVSFSPDGVWLLVVLPDYSIRIIHTESGKIMRECYPQPIFCAIFDPNSFHVIAGTRDDNSVIRFNPWGAKDGLYQAHSSTPAEINWNVRIDDTVAVDITASADKKLVMIIGARKTIRFVHRSCGRAYNHCTLDNQSLWNDMTGAHFMAEGKLFTEHPALLRLWNTTTWECIRVTPYGYSFTKTVVSKPKDTSRVLAGINNEEYVTISDFRDGRRSLHLHDTRLEYRTPHMGVVNTMCINPGGTQLVTGGADGYYAVWDVFTGARICKAKVGPAVLSIAWA
jgi:WD40 repeat protein